MLPRAVVVLADMDGIYYFTNVFSCVYVCECIWKDKKNTLDFLRNLATTKSQILSLRKKKILKNKNKRNTRTFFLVFLFDRTEDILYIYLVLLLLGWYLKNYLLKKNKWN